MTARALGMFQFQQVFEGLGQLAAYVFAEEGVAFEMDNNLIWNSLSIDSVPTIRGLRQKKLSSKFRICVMPSGKVVIQDWRGLYLGVMPVHEDSSFFPVMFVPFRDDIVVQFEVFYKDNKVAFQAFDGLFLASVYKDYETIAAIQAVADDSCCFRPMIGDIDIPTFELVGLDHIDFSRVIFYPSVLKRKTFTNMSNQTKTFTFSMSWEARVRDRIAWKHRWGLGLACLWKFRINGMRIKLEYTKDNEKVVFVSRNIFEQRSRKVKVPPQSVCIAHLLAKKNDYAPVTFTAIIRKMKPNGDVVIMHEPCAWTGMFYSDLQLVYEIHRFPKSCNIM